MVQSSADSLLTVSNDILDFSKIEAGKLQIVVNEFDLRETLASSLNLLGVTARTKGLNLTSRVGEAVPNQLIGDQNRIRQVLTNLLGNAIKFTDEGSVHVDVMRQSRRKIVLRFSVQDTGAGIPADQVQAVLDPFTQVDGSTTRNYGGTGLGLAISKRLAEIMGGKL